MAGIYAFRDIGRCLGEDARPGYLSVSFKEMRAPQVCLIVLNFQKEQVSINLATL